jgi:hypothetical protein
MLLGDGVLTKRMTLIRTLQLEYDLIEIHHNPLLKNKPYLVKIFSYNDEPEELRLEEDEIDNLYNILKKKKYL